ncbi:MAG: glycosyltransferase family 2 protein [Bacteroidales bacterium]|nr:glycosyltransferase family 2 protein [Bacteroidales bacterium]
MNALPPQFVSVTTSRIRVGDTVTNPKFCPHTRITSPEISIVIPLFNEQETMLTLHHSLSDAMQTASIDYEIIYVNDGSHDLTSQLLVELATADSHVVVIQLSRNFGHQAAITAGLDLAGGRAVVVMDGDMQDPPEVVVEMIQRWRKGVSVVYAIRTRRKEGYIHRLGYWGFYRLHNIISDINIPVDAGDFCLMDRQVVQSLIQMPERDRFIRGLRAFSGFRQEGIIYERAARFDGQSKYTIRKLIALAVDGLINFSSFPIRFILYSGLFAFAITLFALTILAIDVIVNHREPRIWALLLSLTTCICSVQLISLGVIGEYIRRIFIEVKGRPSYIIDTVIRNEMASSPGVSHVRSR